MNHEQLSTQDTGDKTQKIDLSRAKVEEGAQFARLAKAMARVQLETQATTSHESGDAADPNDRIEKDFREVLPGVIKSERPLTDNDLAEVWIKLSIVKNNREKIRALESSINDLSGRIASATNEAEKKSLIAEQYRHTTEAALLRKDTFTTEKLVEAKGVSDIEGTMQALEKSGIF